MTEATFGKEIIDRVTAIASQIRWEEDMLVGDDSPDAHDEGDEDPEQLRAESAPQSGGLDQEQDHLFVRIVQLLADQYGDGPIEKLGDDRLKSLVRDAIQATQTWEEGPEMALQGPPVNTALQRALNAHHAIGEDILDHRWPEGETD
jgi:hypothetical protein